MPEAALGDGERAVAVSWYLALMTAVCLESIGADGPIVVEGPFARNRRYVEMLEVATGRGVVVSPAGTGTSLGAALLAAPVAPPAPADPPAPAVGRSPASLCRGLACPALTGNAAPRRLISYQLRLNGPVLSPRAILR